MKKRLYFITTVLAAASVLCLSSCLKDSRYVNFAQSTPIVNFPLGGLVNFGSDAITETPDTDANGTIVRQFAVDIASSSIPTKATTVTLAIDNSIIGAYNSTESSVVYEQMPSNAFVFNTTSVTIPAGKRTAVVSVTFYKNLLDPTKSYMLPIKIAAAPSGTMLSGNLNIHYFHFIGNDFAGAYEEFYTRWNTPDSTTAPSTPRTDLGSTTILPVTPNELQVATAYYVQPRYDITFTKSGSGAGAMYSNWAVQFVPADVASGTTWAANITVTTAPKFRPLKFTFDPSASYTYAQSLQLFRIYYQTASRAIIDEYVHP
ncbi:MAG TPA: DUF1735 domain-containing protein [Mucilaginibacter sp.]|nr:DUF1735 domain-containing protein [Mucilaginibacter sp.]